VFALLLSAVRARLAQTATVLVLTALAVTAVVAGPWCAIASARTAAAVDVAGATAGQRTVAVREQTGPTPDPRQALADFRQEIERTLTIPGERPTVGIRQGTLANGRGVPLAYRDQLCQHVRIAGACPSAPDEGLLNTASAEVLGLKVGQQIALQKSDGDTPELFRIVGLYDMVDPAGDYWADDLFRADPSSNAEPPFFVPLEAFAGRLATAPTLVYDATLPDALLRGDGGYDLAGRLRQIDYQFGIGHLHLVSFTALQLLADIQADRHAIYEGVLISAVTVLLLAWLSLAVAGRYTGRSRRPDVALMKLRGSTRHALLRLTLGQQFVPVLGGVVVGVPAGLLVATSLTGLVTTGKDARTALTLSATGVVVALVGALIVLVVAEVSALRAPVVLLLRDVPPRRRGWRGDVVDAAVVALAVAAVYQARVTHDPRFGPIVALAVAVLLARLVGLLAAGIAAGNLRAGRLRSGLTAVQLARRPGVDRVLALLIVAVALIGTAGHGFLAAADARTAQAARELGAPRVLTVQAVNREALLHAVHLADPDGKRAMAAVVNTTTQPPVLAVEASRLAAIGALLDAEPLRQKETPAVTATTARVGLDVRNNESQPVKITASFVNERSGIVRSAAFVVPRPGRQAVTAPLAGCADGCRFVGFTLPAGSLTIWGLAQQNPDRVLLEPATLSDPRRWRGDFTGTLGADATVAAKEGLTLAARHDQYLDGPAPDTKAYLVDAPLPLPAIVAGTAPRDSVLSDTTVRAFGGERLPIHVVRTVATLPVVGNGVLIDLVAAARASVGVGAGGSAQVWLSASAGPDVVDRLKANGLVVVADQSQPARRQQLAHSGAAVIAWAALAAAVAAVLLAAAALAVALAVDREPQAAGLAALRMQGLTARAARAVTVAGPVWLVALGLAGGVLAALLSRAAVGS
jgi:putative ABC transport system permease protein